MKKHYILLAFFGSLISLPLFAQETADAGASIPLDSNSLTILIIMGIILLVILILLVLMVYLMTFLSAIFKSENPLAEQEPSWWESFKLKFLTGNTEEEQNTDKLMTDHSYDGIQELDNFMPPWLQYVFIGTIIYAVGYFAFYTVLGIGKTGVEEYEEELKIEAVAASLRSNSMLASIDETNVELDNSAAALGAGKTIYEANCAACHAIDGGGGVGPNLTDQYWLHGGDIKDVFTVIKYGVIEKGMVPWEDQLSPQEIQEVGSYILSLKGSSPAAPKDPQGEIYAGGANQPDEVEESVPSDSTAVAASAAE